MDTFQEFVYDMKTVRHLADRQIIITDEVLRAAGKSGAKSGQKLRSMLVGGITND